MNAGVTLGVTVSVGTGVAVGVGGWSVGDSVGVLSTGLNGVGDDVAFGLKVTVGPISVAWLLCDTGVAQAVSITRSSENNSRFMTFSGLNRLSRPVLELDEKETQAEI